MTKQFEKLISIFPISKHSGSLADFFKFLYTLEPMGKEERAVSVCIDFTEEFSLNSDVAANAWDHFLCNVVFHPSYYVRHNTPVIFYRNFTGLDNDVNKKLTLIKTKLQEQGFADVWFAELTQSIAPFEKGLPVIDMASVKTFYKEAYLKHGIYNQCIVFAYKNYESLVIAENELLQAEQIFFEKAPMLYRTLQQLATLSEEVETLRWNQDKHLNEIENYKTYLKIVLAQDEARLINDFYYHEYEILPLWYKRLGHIIKVMTGKRTLKSLFNDNVKKYK